MYTKYSVLSMALYIVFFSCLASISIATWKLFETGDSIYYILNNMKIIETHPKEIGLVLWDHCQNLLDDPRIIRNNLVSMFHFHGIFKKNEIKSAKGTHYTYDSLALKCN